MSSQPKAATETRPGIRQAIRLAVLWLAVRRPSKAFSSGTNGHVLLRRHARGNGLRDADRLGAAFRCAKDDAAAIP